MTGQYYDPKPESHVELCDDGVAVRIDILLSVEDADYILGAASERAMDFHEFARQALINYAHH